MRRSKWGSLVVLLSLVVVVVSCSPQIERGTAADSTARATATGPQWEYLYRTADTTGAEGADSAEHISQYIVDTLRRTITVRSVSVESGVVGTPSLTMYSDGKVETAEGVTTRYSVSILDHQNWQITMSSSAPGIDLNVHRRMTDGTYSVEWGAPLNQVQVYERRPLSKR